VYAGAADLIFVIAIAHGSREPGYWQPRIQVVEGNFIHAAGCLRRTAVSAAR